ncbi:MAG: sulfurtransferase [Methylobacter sp.]|nr:MAG: sulfurtransferase [Methylobacter sp.]PPD33905.1 MAG: sulfurtransferase [Methylomonas sp.]
MNYKTLISADTLKHHLNDSNWIIVDCRFALMNPDYGSTAYRLGHLPGARYADLNRDLSSEVRDYTGRHPLPDINRLAKQLGTWGINNHSQVVAYDDAAGTFAARLWWLLRYLGHEKVAVLDGGLPQWQRQGYPVATALPKIKPAVFRPYVETYAWLTAAQVRDRLAVKTLKLIDARAAERYRGEQEPIDPVAGHIPGALNRPFNLNLKANGTFLPAERLAEQFNALLHNTRPEQTAHMCGSGVTACHNLLAMEYAGLSGSKLYAGSWSEWIRDKNRAVATAC